MRIKHPDVVDGAFVFAGVAYPIVDGVFDGPAEALAEIHGAEVVVDAAHPPVVTTIAPPPLAADSEAAKDESLAKATVGQVAAALMECDAITLLDEIEASELRGKNRKGVLEAIAARRGELLAAAAARDAALAEEAAKAAAAAGETKPDETPV